ncbi:hypothetical protein KK062_24855 [Fulvivirgaceae bacterium PWU5]|uniref:Uncharacterized protein n=1 Tax=Dawidia cretensis TaxID=2782350 RepID=A0AAP2E1Y6_9BACT|nr:hypothetical protein [Dawidia cretensis]MBT1711496.1 hypothetical protein [Dawidia cretensis]
MNSLFNLRNVLFLNGISSGATGALLAVFAGTFASWFGVTTPTPFVEVGLFLVAFAALVIVAALRQPQAPGLVRLIIVLDVSWVLVSILVVVLQPVALSLVGNLLILGVAAWVAAMAGLQRRGLSQPA